MSSDEGSPVGTWTGTVAHSNQVDKFRISFAEDGTLSLQTELESGVVSAGTGTWTRTGDDTFSYRIQEIFHDEQGRAAHVFVAVDAVTAGEKYTGTGTGELRTPEGHLIYETVPVVDARLEIGAGA